MGILADKNTRAIVQGITGSQGRFHTGLMLEYGARIVAGVTPGRGGMKVNGVPVYDTVKEALDENEAEASIIFVPAPSAKDAALEALDAKLNPIVIITEGIPVRDSMEIIAHARNADVAVIGPNTPGIITPEECKLGIMPSHVFKKGKIGIASRSGTLTYEVASGITKCGLGQSTCIGLGGDPLVGLSFIDVLEMFDEDEETEAVVLIGEIGGSLEELAADYVKDFSYPKPIAAYIAGRTAPIGKRMGHAGAIVLGKTGTAQSKINALRDAGVYVAEKPSDISNHLLKAVGK